MFESGIWKVSDFAALVLLQSVNSLFSNTGQYCRPTTHIVLAFLLPDYSNSLNIQMCLLMRLHGKSVTTVYPWKVRTNDFYSRISVESKKRTTERSERVSFLIHRNEWLKIIRVHFPWHDVFILYTQRFTLLSTKRTTVKIHRSSNQRHEQ